METVVGSGDAIFRKMGMEPHPQPDLPASPRCPFRRLHVHNSPDLFSQNVPPELTSFFLEESFDAGKFSSILQVFRKRQKADLADGSVAILLENLTHQVTTADEEHLQLLKEAVRVNLSSLLLPLFQDESKCRVKLAFYCFFFNVLARGLTSAEELTSTLTLKKIKGDVLTALDNSCSCAGSAGDNNNNNSCGLTSSWDRVTISSCLLIPLLLTPDPDRDLDLDLDDLRDFCTRVLQGICDDSKIFLGRESSEAKNILTNVLISQNLWFGSASPKKNAFLQALATLGGKGRGQVDLSPFKEKILTNFHQEVFVCREGLFPNVPAALGCDSDAIIGVHNAGVYGPLKMLEDIYSEAEVEKTFLSFDVLSQVLEGVGAVLGQGRRKGQGQGQGQGEKTITAARNLLRQCQTLLRKGHGQGHSHTYGHNHAQRDEGTMTTPTAGPDPSKGVKANPLTKAMRWPFNVMLRLFSCWRHKNSVELDPVFNIEFLQADKY